MFDMLIQVFSDAKWFKTTNYESNIHKWLDFAGITVSHNPQKRGTSPPYLLFGEFALEVSFTQTQNRIASMSGVVSDTLDIVLSLLISNLVRGFILTYINVFQVGWNETFAFGGR